VKLKNDPKTLIYRHEPYPGKLAGKDIRTPQYYLKKLPRLNKSKIGFNWAGGAGRFSQTNTDNIT